MAKLSIQFVRLSMIGRYNWLLEYTWTDHNHFRVTKQLSWINRGKCNAFVERICSTNWLSLSYPQYGQAKGANCCSSPSKRVDYILAHYNFTWEDAIHFNLSNCQMLTNCKWLISWLTIWPPHGLKGSSSSLTLANYSQNLQRKYLLN